MDKLTMKELLELEDLLFRVYDVISEDLRRVSKETAYWERFLRYCNGV